MMRSFAIAMVLWSATLVSAQRRTSPVQTNLFVAAEQAYSEVDFERTVELATAALEAGALSPNRLVRVYMLLGVSSAALGDHEGARGHFERMLAIDPSAELDDTIPPRLRAPYLEARGNVGVAVEQMGIEAGYVQARGVLRISLSDPFGLIARVRVHARNQGELEYRSSESEARAIAPITISDPAPRVEYWAELLDTHGNQVAVYGSELRPRSIGNAEDPSDGGGTASQLPSFLEEPWFWAAVAGGVVLIAGAITTGVLVDNASHAPIRTGVTFGIR